MLSRLRLEDLIDGMLSPSNVRKGAQGIYLIIITSFEIDGVPSFVEWLKMFFIGHTLPICLVQLERTITLQFHGVLIIFSTQL